MGYEEVETVLPKDFVPTPDPAPTHPKEVNNLPSKTSQAESSSISVYDSDTDRHSNTHNTNKKSRSRMMQRLRGSWRSARSRSRSKSRSEKDNIATNTQKSSTKDKTAKKSKKSKRFPSIRKVESNATDVRDNTTRGRASAAEPKKQGGVNEKVDDVTEEDANGKMESVKAPAGSRPMTPVREGAGSPANTVGTAMTSDTDNNNNNNKATPTTAIMTNEMNGISIEIGDENDQFEVPLSTKNMKEEKEVRAPSPAASIKLTKTRSTDSAAASVRSNKSSRSSRASPVPPSATAATRSKQVEDGTSVVSDESATSSALVVKASSAVVSRGNTPEVPTEEEKKEEPDTATNTTAAAPENALATTETSEKRKWVKNVSVSIAGYKTSFQFSDPMANITQSVNDALDVVSDQALVGQAVALDDIGENKTEDERDYDQHPTKLFTYLQQRAWGLALAQLENDPSEARVWVYRKMVPAKAPNVSDGFKSRALVVQSQALVVQDGEDTRLRWKLLPLHASIVLGAPSEIILEIIRAYPNAATKPDERGSLPVHLAASRLDVDEEGEKVMLQLFGAFPDSIEIADRKGRTPPELAKLARMRKNAEEKRRKNAFMVEDDGIEKTASSFQDEEEDVSGTNGNAEDDADDSDDDRSVMSSMSGRFRRLMSSKSTDTADVSGKKKKKKKKKSKALLKSKSMDWDVDDEEMGPGFAILKPSKSYEQRIKSETIDSSPEAKEEDVDNMGNLNISRSYLTPDEAPGSTVDATLIPLPMTFDDDDARSATYINEDSTDVESTVAEPEPWNEGLRVLLERAAENAGRSGEDVTDHLKTLAEEWVTDVEGLRRLDGEQIDDLFPLLLSREVKRLMNLSDSIDSKFLIEDKDNASIKGRRSIGVQKKKSKKREKRVPRRVKKSQPRRSLRARARSESPKDDLLNTIKEDEESEDEDLSVVTEARTVCSRADSKVRIMVPATKDYDEGDETEEEPSEFDNELQIRKIHAKLIADARKKFPTRESLEVAIRERQLEVEAAVNSGFDVDKQTLSRAALADDEVRKLLPLRLILPTAADLREMIGVLQVHKESALRNINMSKAAKIQGEIDELQMQIDEEEHYTMKKRSSSGSKCISCGEAFAQKKKMVGILRTSEVQCTTCKASMSSGFSVSTADEEQSASGSEKTVKRMNTGATPTNVEEVDGRDDGSSKKSEN